MKVKNWLNRIGEYNTVSIVEDCGDNGVLAYYDGRNSIDEKYNENEVTDFAITGNEVTLFVKTKPLFEELSETAQENCIDIFTNCISPYEDYTDYSIEDFEYTIDEILTRNLYLIDNEGNWYENDGSKVI